jgi:Mn2+/Fe2+ NRAMP family transporter
MKKLKDIALGIITAIGGFIDAGAIVSSSQAGAQFRFSLLWVVVLSFFTITLYVEMAARVAISTRRALFDAVRERLGFRIALLPLVTICLVNWLTIAAEIAGMAYALQMLTGWSYLAWAIPVTLLLWLILWKASFSLVENGSSLLGLFILVFVWSAFALHPPWHEIAGTMWKPDAHGQGFALYGYSALALIGAYASPYQVLFYSSGAIEEEWDESYRWPNRIIAFVGNLFGACVAAAIIIVGAMVLNPHGVKVEQFSGASLGPNLALGAKGLWLFVAGLFFCSMAAGLETALSGSYAVAEYFGWHWKKDEPPARSALFHLAYMGFLIASAGLVLTTLDPIKVTETAMVFNAILLPFTLIPLMLVAGDKRYARPPLTNGRFARIAGWALAALLTIAAPIGIVLYFVTGGGG